MPQLIHARPFRRPPGRAERLPAVLPAPQRMRRFAVTAALVALTGAPAASGATPGGASADAGAQAASPRSSSATSAPANTADGRHALVAAAQRRLHLTADGVLGGRSRAALRRFQRRQGLRVSGRLDHRTLAALRLPAPPRVTAPAGDAGPTLAAIAACESDGVPSRVSADGRHRGKYQFARSTWVALGGTGDPAAAPEAEQDRRAAALYAQQGVKPWPVCGRRATATR